MKNLSAFVTSMYLDGWKVLDNDQNINKEVTATQANEQNFWEKWTESEVYNLSKTLEPDRAWIQCQSGLITIHRARYPRDKSQTKNCLTLR